MKKLKLTKPSPPLHWVGNGFPVRSVFSYDDLGQELDPFLLLDYAAPYEFAPGHEKRGVGAHPHRGFETVTLAFQGEVAHRDSSGGGGIIGPGDVQWMTAGGGLLHEEFHSEAFTERGGTFQMAQLWVNLPAADKSTPPRYQTLLKEDIPTVSLPAGAGQVRVVAGRFGDTVGPAETFTPIDLWDLRLSGGKTVALPVPDGHTTALLAMEGSVAAEGSTVDPGMLAVYQREGAGIELHAEEDAHLLLMGGRPIGEPIVGHGPFVMNSREEIAEAFRDFQEGGMGELA